MKITAVVIITGLIFWPIFAQELQNIDISDLPIYDVTRCSAEDFDVSQNCVLRCSLLSTLPLPKLETWFSYYLNKSGPSVTVHGAELKLDWSSHSFNYTITLHLSNYSSGFYQCNYRYKYPITNTNQTSQFTFRIAKGLGKLMNQTCENASECYALNAQCDDNSRCNCNGLFNINYNDDYNNPACLKHEDVGGLCDLDKECAVENEEYKCTIPDNQYNAFSTCRCNAKYIYVREMNETMCLERVSLFHSCLYNEQCSRNGSVECRDGQCNCAAGYTLNSNWDQCVESPFQLEVTSCTPENFTNNSSCSLSCFVDDKENSTFISSQWIYESTPHSSVVVLFEGVFWNEGSSHEASLQLPTYYSGYYACQFTFQQTSGIVLTVQNVFQIALPDSGVLLHSSCNDSSQCLALNATCSANSCQCTDDYNIQYNYNSDCPACLSPKPQNANCNVDEECDAENQDIDCNNNTCVCLGQMTYVDDVDEELCLAPTHLTYFCTYDEECQLIDQNSVCNDFYCSCKENCFLITNHSSNPYNYYCADLTTQLLCESCIPSDFSSDEPCYSWCALNTTFYTVSSYNWIYQSGDSNSDAYYPFQNDQASAVTFRNVYNTSLKLTDYNSGTYVCNIFAKDSTDTAVNFTFTFRIAVALGEVCSVNEDCVTLNSVCVPNYYSPNTYFCTCPSSYPILFDSDLYTPACLQDAAYNEPCVVDAQCQYDVANSVCADGYCQCLSGSGSDCDVPTEYNLTGGAIAGIVIGSLIGCAIIAWIVYSLCKTD